MKFRSVALLLSAVISVASPNAIAKVAPRKPVPPVESNGIRYAADGDGNDQFVVATEIATGKQLWRKRVLHTRIKFWLEPDVQIVPITEIKLVDGLLFVRDERARCYAVGVRNHRVHKTACGSTFAEQEGPTR